MDTRKNNLNIMRLAGILISLAVLLYSCEDLLSDLDSGDDRDKLVDTWKVEEESSPIKSEEEIYWVEIEKHPDKPDMVRIYFFHGLGNDIYAEASLDGTTLALGYQVLQGGWTFQGSAEVQKGWDEIIWSYTVDDGSGLVENVLAVYTKIGL